MGIFCANSALRETTIREGRFSWWSLSKKGYLPLRMRGYGMSLFAWARGERKPEWMKALRLDARESMSNGLRYLWKSGDSVFRINRDIAEATNTVAERGAGRLTHHSASFRFLGLWELLDETAVSTAVIDKVANLTNDHDPDISSTAARLLGVIGKPAQAHVPRLLDMLGNRATSDREQAAFALGELRPNEPLVCRELARLLDDEKTEVCCAAAEALGKLGPPAQSAAKQILKRYEKALIKCDASVDPLALALTRVFPDAPALVREHFSDVDAELCSYAEQCLTDVQTHNGSS